MATAMLREPVRRKPRRGAAIQLGKPESLPRHITPMLALLGEMPSKQVDYGFEVKWDGVRALAYWDGKRVTLESRNGADITAGYPDVAALGKSLGKTAVVLDGEIIATDDQGRPSFQRLQSRMHVRNAMAVKKLVQTTPVMYVIFDVLHYGGKSTRELPYVERRRLLDSLGLDGPAWTVGACAIGDGRPLLAFARGHQLEGIVAKRLDSRYAPGQRTGEWLKVKFTARQELVIGGWIPGERAKAGLLGSVQLGYYDRTPAEAKKRGVKQRFIFAGGVGTGFDDRLRGKLRDMLERLEIDQSPFDTPVDGPRRRLIHFVEPTLVAEIEFRGWTKDNHVRQGAFVGLREDKDPRAVVRDEVRHGKE